jgi:hypothetical protein
MGKTTLGQDEDYTGAPESEDEAPEAPEVAADAPEAREILNVGADGGEVVIAQILQEAMDDEAQENEDSASVESDRQIELIWEVPSTVIVDRHFVQELATTQFIGPLGSAEIPHTLYGQRGLSRGPNELLNDVCINGCSALLQHQFDSTYPHAEQSRRCAILSTFDLPRVRYKCSDKDLWRNLQGTSYWDKHVWILPIHRPNSGGHWVLCIIAPHSRELFLFDSLGQQRPWRQNMRDIMTLIIRMVSLANRNSHPLHVVTEGWTARPVSTCALQTNHFDCGVWVLACVAAVLRGCHVTGCTEEDMFAVRSHLVKLICNLPEAM